MPVTKEQAVEENEFHRGECSVEVGPRGGETVHIERWRRMGQTKLWKTRPDDFRVPIKFGMRARDSWYLTPDNAHEFHTADECPLEA
jgi:hypothetical protein